MLTTMVVCAYHARDYDGKIAYIAALIYTRTFRWIDIDLSPSPLCAAGYVLLVYSSSSHHVPFDKLHVLISSHGPLH